MMESLTMKFQSQIIFNFKNEGYLKKNTRHSFVVCNISNLVAVNVPLSLMNKLFLNNNYLSSINLKHVFTKHLFHEL